MTSHYIFYKINIVFDTITDVEVIPNPALDGLFLLNYPLKRQLLGAFQDFYTIVKVTRHLHFNKKNVLSLCPNSCEEEKITLSFFMLPLHTFLH